MDQNDDIKKDPIRTFVDCDAFVENDKKIIDFMSFISKNIYNTTIFHINIFDTYYFEIKADLMSFVNEYIISKNFKDDNDLKKFFSENEKDTIFLIQKKLEKIYIKYYSFYSKMSKIIKTINNLTWSKIFELNKIEPLINTNMDYYLSKIFYIVTSKIGMPTTIDSYKLLVSMINKHIQHAYIKNYNLTLDQIKNKIPCTIKNEQFINDIMSRKIQIPIKIGINKELKELLGITFYSKQFTIKQIVENYFLGENKDKLPSDIISNIIDKTYKAYQSYLKLKSKSIHCNRPNFQKTYGRFNLLFTASSRKLITINNIEYVRLTVGSFVANRYVEITGQQNMVSIFTTSKNVRCYVDEKYLVSLSEIKGKVEDYYKTSKTEEINGKKFNKYVNKNDSNIVDTYYLYIKMPPKIDYTKLGLIDVSPVYDGHKYNVSFCYKIQEIEINYDPSDLSNSFFADLGIINIITLFDPTGKEQNIISGGWLVSLNKYYNMLIDENKKELTKCNSKNIGQRKVKHKIGFVGVDEEVDNYNNSLEDLKKINTTKRIRNLLVERENKIDGYFTEICNFLLSECKEKQKKCIIFGYNKNWKNNCNLGRKTNRKFYEIPFARLLDKIKWKLNAEGIDVQYTEESYTSKCDALNMETVEKHNEYSGKRVKRGLFSSAIHKYINADINGAINICRKYMAKKGKEIKLEDINMKGIYNPKKIKNIWKQNELRIFYKNKK